MQKTLTKRGEKVNFEKQGLTMIAGRPGMGKTTLACQWIEALSPNFEETALFLLRPTSFYGFDCYAEGEINHYESPWQALRTRHPEIHVVYSSAMHSLSVIEHYLAWIVKNKKAKYIFVDSLDFSTKNKDKETEEAGCTAHIAGLLSLAHRYGVNIIAECNVSRQCERRKDKRPTVEDLPISGEVLDDINAIVFVYREEYYKH